MAKLPISGSQTESGDLVSQIWADGFCRFTSKTNAKDGVADREANQRVKLRSLAVNARDLADQLDRIMRAKPEEMDFRMKVLLWNALMKEVIDEKAENGPTPVGIRLRFPNLTPDLRAFSDAVEECLRSRVDPEKELETPAEDIAAFRLNAFLGNQLGQKTIVEMLSDSKGHVHWSVWRMLLKILHPGLKGKFDNRELKHYARRMLSPHGGIPPQ